MTLDEAVALALIDDLPRPGLTGRLVLDDPELHERAARGASAARVVRERAAARGIGVLPWNDPRFPAPLLAIPDCPPALWYRGQPDAVHAPCVAVVGSRAATAVAREAAAQISADLAACGVTVVSGLARGVDSAAHRGALLHGTTIAVLGSGLGRIYPREHVELAETIAKTGLLLSEFPPSAAPLPFRFPLRNRIISGLSRAVVVIEASDHSGSLITARCALDQGREVMAVPGNVLSGRNRGGHALLRDGATIVEGADDILAALALPRAGIAGGPRPEADAAADPLLRGMARGHGYDLDALADLSGLDIGRLLPRISDLELRGLIRRVEGGRFIRP